MLETKILISYIAICLTYSICRLHYLLTTKSDEEFNSMLDELVDLSGSKDIIKTLIVLQIVLSPITTPFSMLKQIYKLTVKKD
jgi:hypothetical protein